MSYVDEVIEKVVAQNPAEPEFHQAVKEVLESLRAVVEATGKHWLPRSVQQCHRTLQRRTETSSVCKSWNH